MSKFNWNYPTTIWVGKNRIDDLSIACKNLNINRPLFVTDNELVKTNLFKKVYKRLKNMIPSSKIFSNVKGNPTGKNVTEGVSFFKKK